MKLSAANIRSILFHTKLKKTVLSAQTVLHGPQNNGMYTVCMYVCVQYVCMYVYSMYVCMYTLCMYVYSMYVYSMYVCMYVCI